MTVQYQGIFDTDVDKYTEDAVQLFSQSGMTTVFANLEGFPEDWTENPDVFVQFVRDHHYRSISSRVARTAGEAQPRRPRNREGVRRRRP